MRERREYRPEQQAADEAAAIILDTRVDPFLGQALDAGRQDHFVRDHRSRVANPANVRGQAAAQTGLSQPIWLRKRLETRCTEVGVEGDRPSDPLPTHEDETRPVDERDR